MGGGTVGNGKRRGSFLVNQSSQAVISQVMNPNTWNKNHRRYADKVYGGHYRTKPGLSQINLDANTLEKVFKVFTIGVLMLIM